MLYFIGIALIAFLYSIVGHAGASGYIACMVIFDKPVSLIKPTALILNLAASTLNSIRFCGDGHLKKYTLVNFLIPILLVSIPSTIVGGNLNITDNLLRYFLSLILFLSGIRFLITSLIIKNNTITDYKLPSKIVIFFTGSILGLLSGITGTGGGIFLTPLSILLKWMPLKTTAAASSVFIFFNSLVGIITWQTINNFSKINFTSNIFLNLIVVLFFAFCGSSLGSRKFDDNFIKKIISFILFLASFKLAFA
ncbi:sulfite exporter TauE/SafE family protein [Prochlorococcus marinus]|uniref:sulfite exporter TauE/SafE family protein n=1 Tax=Prochlorococcus marinus TaxID=1219 RepID=UPI0022B2BF68|nr:sulfite exporter TauE/SafE family protein [Prochlorococcus marinus]